MAYYCYNVHCSLINNNLYYNYYHIFHPRHYCYYYYVCNAILMKCKAFFFQEDWRNNKKIVSNNINKYNEAKKTQHFPEGGGRGSHVRRFVGADRLPGGDDATPLGTPAPRPRCSCEPRPPAPPPLPPARYP